MKEKIIENWNAAVAPEDLCIFVGDIFFYHGVIEMKETLDRMNGRKILVRGNHDMKPRQMMNAGFEICVEQMEMNVAGEFITISHYPFRMPKWKFRLRKFINKIKKKLGFKRVKWPEKYHNKRPKDRGQFLIHGHTHRKQKAYGRAIHVGVDGWDFKPVNIQDISHLVDRIKKSEAKHGKSKTRIIV